MRVAFTEDYEHGPIRCHRADYRRGGYPKEHADLEYLDYSRFLLTRRHNRRKLCR